MFLFVVLFSIRQWHRSREMARQLAALIDGELSDIVLTRGYILQAARQGRQVVSEGAV